MEYWGFWGYLEELKNFLWHTLHFRSLVVFVDFSCSSVRFAFLIGFNCFYICNLFFFSLLVFVLAPCVSVNIHTHTHTHIHALYMYTCMYNTLYMYMYWKDERGTV